MGRPDEIGTFVGILSLVLRDELPTKYDQIVLERK
jgi:hypothetical protein